MVEHALRCWWTHSDNVTVLAMEWEAPDVFESTRGVSTDSIMDGVFASNHSGGWPGYRRGRSGREVPSALDRRDQQKPFAVLPLQV
jgi:hypothetical protein